MLPFCLVPLLVSLVEGKEHYTAHYDTEYDYSILDPFHANGHPYGGFSRATRDRLAALPLYLPEISEETASEDPVYLEVRDKSGKLFACRVYHEDELDPESLDDSVFDVPRLRNEIEPSSVSAKDTTASDERQVASKNVLSQQTQSEPQSEKATVEQRKLRDGSTSSGNTAPSSHTQKPGSENANAAKQAMHSSIGNANKPPFYDPSSLQSQLNGIVDLITVEKRLLQLKGICGQIHKGYWSYEWCYEGEISQFHIAFEQSSVRVEGVTKLGKFKNRNVMVHLDKLPPNEMAEDIPEIARVRDRHEGGTLCEETGKPRMSYVNMLCCSEKVVQKQKGMIHRDGHQIASDIAAVLDVHEDPEAVCVYNVTVCTPLLCGEGASDPGAATGDILSRITKEVSGVASSLLNAAPPKENESIREILDRTLSQLCLQTNSGGEWWSYAFCHKQDIRQFHEVAVSRRNSAGVVLTSKEKESEHILGKYDAETAKEAIPDEEEWKLVVNATTADGKNWGEGNGAYYQVEYVGGDVCDHSDVTDSAIVAGSIGSRGVERASSVRFYCGESYDIAVSEDHTCHYVVKVKLPDLCQHPLFKAPVSKKQVMKCLPVDE